jgi:Sec-independent protein secretion pathway component TatC
VRGRGDEGGVHLGLPKHLAHRTTRLVCHYWIRSPERFSNMGALMTSQLRERSEPNAVGSGESWRPAERFDDRRKHLIMTALVLAVLSVASYVVVAPPLLYRFAGQLDLLDGCGFKSWLTVCDPNIPRAIVAKASLFVTVAAMVPILVLRWQNRAVPHLAARFIPAARTWLLALALLYAGGSLFGFLAMSGLLRVLPPLVELVWPQLRPTDPASARAGKAVLNLYVTATVSGGFSMILPGVMVACARLGIVAFPASRFRRRVAFPLLLLVTAIVTVKLDALFVVIALPLYAAYELGLLLATRFVDPTTAPNPT